MTKLSAGAATAALFSGLGSQVRAAENDATETGAKFQHSACHWAFRKVPLKQFCAEAKNVGLASIELLHEKDWSLLQEHGLTCAVGRARSKGDIGSIGHGFNRKEYHETLFDLFKTAIEKAAKAGNVPQLICFSGNRNGMDDEEGLKNCAEGLKKIMPVAEKHGITLTMELLNSKRNHQDYMCDRTHWGADLVDAVGSERFKLLYDIFHMQIQEGDVIKTFTKYKDRISHYHTAGVPGRNEINDTQELNYRGICKALAATGYTGFLAQEFKPKGDTLTSLKEAIEICSV